MTWAILGQSIWMTVVGFMIAYLMGSVLYSKIIGFAIGRDASVEGSRNPGATNSFRVYGKWFGFWVLFADTLKSIVSFLILWALVKYAGFNYMVIPIAMIGVIVGHIYPIFFKFKGGKGVAVFGGLLLIVNWILAVIALVILFSILFWKKKMSLAVIISALIVFSLSFIEWLWTGHTLIIPGVVINWEWWPLTFGAFVLLMLFKHKDNIIRLIKKEEASAGQEIVKSKSAFGDGVTRSQEIARVKKIREALKREKNRKKESKKHG